MESGLPVAGSLPRESYEKVPLALGKVGGSSVFAFPSLRVCTREKLVQLCDTACFLLQRSLTSMYNNTLIKTENLIFIDFEFDFFHL